MNKAQLASDLDGIAALCTELCAQCQDCAQSRKRAALLQRMFDICSLAVKSGHLKFTFEAVARLCHAPRFQGDLSGPVVGSIRNAGGMPYQLLIRAFAKLAAPARKQQRRVPQRRVTALQQALASADLHVKLHVAELETRYRRATQELRQARQQPMPIVLLDEASMRTVNPPPALELTAQELQSLRAAIAPAALMAQGLRADSEGRILDAQGITVLRAGFCAAIEKVLEHAVPSASSTSRARRTPRAH
jgi:hypothetical protein